MGTTGQAGFQSVLYFLSVGPGDRTAQMQDDSPLPSPSFHPEGHTQPCRARSPQVWLPRCVGPTVILTATVLLPESLSGTPGSVPKSGAAG